MPAAVNLQEANKYHPNYPKIFNHQITHHIQDKITGHYYGGRALGCSMPEDIIQLHPDIMDQWPLITDHYNRIQLTHTKQVIWDNASKYFKKYRHYEASISSYDDSYHQSIGNQAWHDTVKHITSRNIFIHVAKELKIPTPSTICYANKHQIKNFQQFSFPCFLKTAAPFSTKDIFRCENPMVLKHAVSQLASNTSLQIQEEIKITTLINMQYEVVDHKLQQLATTENIKTADNCYQGYRHPTPYAPWSITEPMAQWLFQQGIKGSFSFDVAVNTHEKNAQYTVTACHPHFTEVSYAIGIAKKLNIKQWASHELETKYRSLNDFQLKDMEYNPRTKTGIIIINWGSLLAGHLEILIAGTTESQDMLLKELKRRLD